MSLREVLLYYGTTPLWNSLNVGSYPGYCLWAEWEGGVT